MNPTRKNKGSAIFIHIVKRKFRKTAGCVAIRKLELLKIVREITTNTKVKIVDRK